MADTYPTLGRVFQVLDSIADRHATIDQLYDEAAQLATAEGQTLLTPDLSTRDGHDG